MTDAIDDAVRRAEMIVGDADGDNEGARDKDGRPVATVGVIVTVCVTVTDSNDEAVTDEVGQCEADRDVEATGVADVQSELVGDTVEVGVAEGGMQLTKITLPEAPLVPWFVPPSVAVAATHDTDAAT